MENIDELPSQCFELLDYIDMHGDHSEELNEYQDRYIDKTIKEQRWVFQEEIPERLLNPDIIYLCKSHNLIHVYKEGPGGIPRAAIRLFRTGRYALSQWRLRQKEENKPKEDDHHHQVETAKANADGFVERPADPTAYLPATKIIEKYPGIIGKYENQHKRVDSIIRKHAPNIRWTKPSKNKKSVHLADWDKAVGENKPSKKDQEEDLSEEEIMQRIDESKREREMGNW